MRLSSFAVPLALTPERLTEPFPFRSIAVDHLTDMATLGLTGSVIETSGGYQSMALADYDSSDTSQHWKITSA